VQDVQKIKKLEEFRNLLVTSSVVNLKKKVKSFKADLEQE
jgi:hypothetical protein